MDKQQKKELDWSKFFPEGKPDAKQRLELKKIKSIMEELEIDIEGYDFATEESFREFVKSTKTPGKNVVEFLKRILSDAKIKFKGNHFSCLDRTGYLELFFEVFTLGIHENGGDSAEKLQKSSSSQDAAKGKENPVVDAEVENLTLEAMNSIYENSNKKDITSFVDYTRFTITDKIPVRAQDNFSLRIGKDAPPIAYGKAALFNVHQQKTVAVGHLEGTAQEPKLVFSDKDMDYASIKKNRKHEIILFPANEKENVFYSIECEVGFRELEDTKRTLCIDFGTSNTTAGSFGILDERANEPEYVEFPDGDTVKRMLPTLVYVDSCEDEKSIRYAFGYDARKRIQDDHFESKASVFYEIKSWLNDLDHEEEIFDAQGNNGKVRREDVIKAYLEHVISLSEQYFHKKFKALHFSAPVKLKDSFLGKMRQMFSKDKEKDKGYVVLRDSSSLDEGIAIVYNHISKRMEEKLEDGKTETVFVIDCGGGTTDLAKCEYSQRESSIDGKKILSVKTSFENGDSAFGGNNITYRILQILKIKIHACLQQKENPPDMLKIISDNENEIMTKLDESAEDKEIFERKEALYENFRKAYESAEDHIPTKHKEAKYEKDILYMQRNYNYLWQMAEAIKIEFYKAASRTVNVNFNEEKDRNLCIGGQEDYYLYTRKDQNSPMEKTLAPLQNISITIKEIERVICPDIYALLSILLGGYDNKPLQEVDYYKLSGQSCNIPLFHALMKEFVPGRSIRPPRLKSSSNTEEKRSEKDRTEELKMACLEGSIRYLMAKESSQIKPDITMDAPKMLYHIYEKESDREVLSANNACLLRNFTSGRSNHFIVRDAYGQQKKEIAYEYISKEEFYITNQKGKKEIASLNLCNVEANLCQDTYWGSDMIKKIINELKNITLHGEDEEEQCIFLLPAKNGYGFRIYQVRVIYDKEGATKYGFKQSEGKIYGEYHSFEQMASFFDGKR